jgi:Ca2+-binding RTX toxin-like protein
LTVTSSATADTIALQLVAPEDPQIAVTLNGKISRFPVNDVSQISIAANGGDDKVTIGPAINASATVSGGAGNDTITGDIVSDVRGDAGNDLLVSTTGCMLDGGAGNDTLLGGSGDDMLIGGSGADLMKGGGGNDTADYSTRTENLVIGLGTAADDGAAGEHDNVWFDIETVYGGSGNDRLSGNGSRNDLFGFAGNDTLTGGGAADRLLGGDGADIATDASADDTVADVEKNSTGLGASLAIDAATHNLVVRGTAGRDNVGLAFGTDDFGRPTAFIEFNGHSYFFPTDGVTQIKALGLGGDDHFSDGDVLYSIGETGPDILFDGGSGNDSFDVQDSRARINAGSGNDTITIGGDYHFGSATNAFTDGGGTDWIELRGDYVPFDPVPFDLHKFPGVENVIAENANVVGSDGPNLIILGVDGEAHGGGGNDTLQGTDDQPCLLDGGPGDDLLKGGQAAITMIGGSGADTFIGGGGYATVDYSARKANLTVSIGNNLADDGEAGEHDNVGAGIGKVIGGSGNDLLRGDSAANVLLGLAGNDTLFGGGGNDALFGGSGNDQLNGEAGNDYLEGQSGADKLDGGIGTDTALADGSDVLVSIESR